MKVPCRAALLLIVGAASMVAACRRAAVEDAGIAPAPLLAPAGAVDADPLYAITDTSEWANLLEEGTRGVLRRGGVVIDTVDMTFGVAMVCRDSLVFLPVRSNTFVEDDTLHFADDSTDEHVLWTPAGQRELRSWLPHFVAYYSSPAVLDSSTIYYWGIAPRDTSGLSRVYAVRYDFRTGRLDSLFLRSDDIATDYRYYFGLPHRHRNLIVFGGILVDPRSWQVHVPSYTRMGALEVTARSEVTGRGADTLVVALTLVNGGNESTEVELTHTWAGLRTIRDGEEPGQSGGWDGGRWADTQRGTLTLPRADHAGCFQTCKVMLAPDEAMHAFALVVPVHAVLGDSLPEGRYIVDASFSIGNNGRGVPAGEVTLRARPGRHRQ